MHWDSVTDVVVIGNGGAGAAAALAAREEGADVLVLEKQPEEDHWTSTGMSGGGFHFPASAEAIKYLESLYRIPAGCSWVEPDIIRTYVEYGQGIKSWVDSLGGQLAEVPFRQASEHPELPGYDAFIHYKFAGMGYGLQRFLHEVLPRKGIHISYNTRAERLITGPDGRVLGVEVEDTGTSGAESRKIGATKGIVLACGGFEYNEAMKLNYLPVHPTYFTGHQSATGDGIRMAMRVGADLWHMNCVSARLVAKFPEFPIAFSISPGGMGVRGARREVRHESSKPMGYVIVDQNGERFTNEDFKHHAVYYEVTFFDTHRFVYPRVPCYWVMDQRRIEADALVTLAGGAAGPCRFYEWSRDNSKELDKGWIATAGSVRELAGKIGVPAEHLEKTVEAYNRCCLKGKDPEFNRGKESLVPLDEPPFFALKLWPGGPNTQGGPRRNARCQVLNIDEVPIGGLYGAGEMGSMFGMLYPSGGSNLAECLAMGRVAGESVAHEPSK